MGPGEKGGMAAPHWVVAMGPGEKAGMAAPHWVVAMGPGEKGGRVGRVELSGWRRGREATRRCARRLELACAAVRRFLGSMVRRPCTNALASDEMLSHHGDGKSYLRNERGRRERAVGRAHGTPPRRVCVGRWSGGARDQRARFDASTVRRCGHLDAVGISEGGFTPPLGALLCARTGLSIFARRARAAPPHKRAGNHRAGCRG
eukprot:2566317-Prymnesium_polylepis.1